MIDPAPLLVFLDGPAIAEWLDDREPYLGHWVFVLWEDNSPESHRAVRFEYSILDELSDADEDDTPLAADDIDAMAEARVQEFLDLCVAAGFTDVTVELYRCDKQMGTAND